MTIVQVKGIMEEHARLRKLQKIHELCNALELLEAEVETWRQELLFLEKQYQQMIGRDSTKAIKKFVVDEILPMDDLIEGLDHQIDESNRKLSLLVR